MPRGNPKFSSMVQNCGIKVGAICSNVDDIATMEMKGWLIDKVGSGKYANVAEFLVDVALDVYWEDQSK